MNQTHPSDTPDPEDRAQQFQHRGRAFLLSPEFAHLAEAAGDRPTPEVCKRLARLLDNHLNGASDAPAHAEDN